MKRPNYTKRQRLCLEGYVGRTASHDLDKFGSQAAYSAQVWTGKVFLNPRWPVSGGETLQFRPALDDTGTPAPATVTWSLQGGALGTVSAAGLYTAPAAVTMPNTDYVTARDAAGASATASVALHL